MICDEDLKGDLLWVYRWMDMSIYNLRMYQIVTSFPDLFLRPLTWSFCCWFSVRNPQLTGDLRQLEAKSRRMFLCAELSFQLSTFGRTIPPRSPTQKTRRKQKKITRVGSMCSVGWEFLFRMVMHAWCGWQACKYIRMQCTMYEAVSV